MGSIRTGTFADLGRMHLEDMCRCGQLIRRGTGGVWRHRDGLITCRVRPAQTARPVAGDVR